MNTLASSNNSMNIVVSTKLSPKRTSTSKDRIDVPMSSANRPPRKETNMQRISDNKCCGIMKKENTVTVSKQTRLDSRRLRLSDETNNSTHDDALLPRYVRRKVRFSDDRNNTTDITAQIIPIDTIKSRRVKCRLWYSGQDLASILKRELPILTLMDMGYTDETIMTKLSPLLNKYNKEEIAEMTTRGLERQSKKGIQRFHAVSRLSIEAVLQCQHHERMMYRNMCRVETIAAVYAVTTNESQKASNRRANKDAIYVRNHCIEPGDCNMNALRRQQQQQNLNKKSTTTARTLFGIRRLNPMKSIGQ